MRMKQGSVIAGILLVVLAGALWIGSASFPAGSMGFPRAIAVVIVVLTALMLVENASIKDFAAFDWQHFNYFRTISAGAITCVYMAQLAYVGFLVSTPIYLLIMMYVMEKGSLWTKIAAALGTTGVIYFVFAYLLDVPLPAWDF
ncbi:MAG: tripartite tricarboxylate transporter TctB family protein [Propionivibrio sp.]